MRGVRCAHRGCLTERQARGQTTSCRARFTVTRAVKGCSRDRATAPGQAIPQVRPSERRQDRGRSRLHRLPRPPEIAPRVDVRRARAGVRIIVGARLRGGISFSSAASFLARSSNFRFLELSGAMRLPLLIK